MKIQSESNIEQMGKQIQGPSSFKWFPVVNSEWAVQQFPRFSLTEIGLRGKSMDAISLMEKLGKQEIGRHVMCAMSCFLKSKHQGK